VHGRPLDFADLIARAERSEFAGVTVTLASLDDIIASRRYANANRDKDREALPELLSLRDELHRAADG